LITVNKRTPVGFDIKIEAKSSQKASFVLISDAHLDSKASDLKLFESDMARANEHGSVVLINGDLFDAMQGRYDPRRKPEDLKKDFRVSSYYDALVLWHSKTLQKYKNIPALIIGKGNHETAVLKNSGTDLTERLVHDLRNNGVNAVSAGYWGYIRLMFQYEKGADSSNKVMYFHHGKTTHAEVTRGVIQTARQGVYIKDADLIHNGHTHDAYALPIKVERLNQKTLETDTEVQWYIRTPGYQLSAADTMDTFGFVPERNKAPKPRGCAIVNFHYAKGQGIEMEATLRIK
jgi:hypothetical protein